MLSGYETEVKLPAPDFEYAYRILERLGFRVTRPRVFEVNRVFDTADAELRSSGRLLRLRDSGRTSLLTYKGPAASGVHKSREELETTVADAGIAGRVLERLGYCITFVYEKYRTEFSRAPESGVVTYDETPIGRFFEVEGDPTWIDRVAGELGFSERDYITASYGELYRQWCAARNVSPTDLTFSTAPQSSHATKADA